MTGTVQQKHIRLAGVLCFIYEPPLAPLSHPYPIEAQRHESLS